MDYLLAKKLKNNDYPQTGKDFRHIELNEYVVFPSISEIIEEIGNEFESIRKDTKQLWTARGWVAFGYKKGTQKPYMETGTTPEQAVANLWLLINEKI